MKQLCGNCEIWFSEDIDTKCPRMSRCNAQVKAFGEQLAKEKIKTKNGPLSKQLPKLFDGVAMFDDACDKYRSIK
jgi:hypothetical protein